MSPFTRYGFALFIGVFGIYQIRNEQFVTAGIAIVLAIAMVLLGRRS